MNDIAAKASVSAIAMFPRDRFFHTDGLSRPQTLYEPSVVAGWALLGLGARL